MKNIIDVIDNNMCSGCGLCSASPDFMNIDNQGFLRPDKPIDDEISQNCCPGIKVVQKNRSNYNVTWGPVSESYTGYSSDSDVRNQGSSGGVLTSILKYLLEQNIVDAVVQVGVSESNPIQNEVKIVDDPDSLIKNAGSRYAPSSPLSVIRSLLGNGKKYAIVAKPCDIAALRSLTELDPVVKNQFPVLLSFMCAGIPSEHATDDVLQKLNVDKNDGVSFRYRGDGWPGLTTAIDKEGKKSSMTYNESWGGILNQKLQARCKLCGDGIGELADIVCADAWYESEDGYPSFEENKGRSLILVRTEQGARILKKVTDASYIVIEDNYPLDNLEMVQPYQSKRKKTVLVRKLALQLLFTKTPVYKGFSLWTLTFQTNLLFLMKVFYGTLVRKLRKRI
jgi:coenzyme F420 hydrogenase subunit beta